MAKKKPAKKKPAKRRNATKAKPKTRKVSTRKATKRNASKAKPKTRKASTRKATKPNATTCGARKAPGLKCTLHKGHKGTHYDSLKDRSFSATKAKRKNPPKRREPVSFAVGGRAPSPETLKSATQDVYVMLKTYQPVKVSSKRAFYPWLVRRAEKVGIGPNVLLHAVCKLAEQGKVALYVDEDHTPSFAPADRALLPRMGDTAEPLVWVDLLK